jgi:hypothetical protein
LTYSTGIARSPRAVISEPQLVISTILHASDRFRPTAQL